MILGAFYTFRVFGTLIRSKFFDCSACKDDKRKFMVQTKSSATMMIMFGGCLFPSECFTYAANTSISTSISGICGNIPKMKDTKLEGGSRRGTPPEKRTINSYQNTLMFSGTIQIRNRKPCDSQNNVLKNIPGITKSIFLSAIAKMALWYQGSFDIRILQTKINVTLLCDFREWFDANKSPCMLSLKT